MLTIRIPCRRQADRLPLLCKIQRKTPRYNMKKNDGSSAEERLLANNQTKKRL